MESNLDENLPTVGSDHNQLISNIKDNDRGGLYSALERNQTKAAAKNDMELAQIHAQKDQPDQDGGSLENKMTLRELKES